MRILYGLMLFDQQHVEIIGEIAITISNCNLGYFEVENQIGATCRTGCLFFWCISLVPFKHRILMLYGNFFLTCLKEVGCSASILLEQLRCLLM